MTFLPFFKVFLERVGCFDIDKELINSLGNQDHPLEKRHPVQACNHVAWSRGLKVFAVYNESECLGDNRLLAILPQLNASEGCKGGRGGENVSDVYRYTSKETHLIYSYNTMQYKYIQYKF